MLSYCMLKILERKHNDLYLLELIGNTRVVNQKELEIFREELEKRMSNNYNVILKERKLPLSLLNDHQKVEVLFYNLLI